MANAIRVEIRGARELAGKLGDRGLIDDALRPGFRKAAVIVHGASQRNVHTVTRKLLNSIGHYLEGYGPSLEAHIGPQPGLGQPRKYTAGQTSHWKKPRAGRNTGDPTVYAIFEERGTRYREGHPFMEPALTENRSDIDDAIESEAAKVLEGRF